MFRLYATTKTNPKKATIITEDTVKEIYDYVAAINQTGREWDLEPEWISCELYGKTMNPNIETNVAHTHGLSVELLNDI